jgi:diketogulonate reductase-like aldo/keto reductase
MKDSPHCPVMQAMWTVVEGLYASGRVKAIGVYNMCEASLRCVLETATVKPMIHYLMRHIGMGPDMDGLIAFGKSHGMQHTVYGSLGEPIALPQLLSDPTLSSIASAHGRTVEEVAIRWNAQSGLAVNLRLNSNYGASNKVAFPEKAPFGSYCTNDCVTTITAMTQVFDWKLTSAEMAAIDALRFDAFPQSPTYYSSAGCPNSFGATMKLVSMQSSCPASGSTWC